MKYVLMVMAGLIVILSLYAKFTRDDLIEAKAKNLVLNNQIEIVKSNVVLLNEQLRDEIMIRKNAEAALESLFKEVSDEEFKQELPEGISKVIRNFHSDIGIE